jgi:hypothetical protein
MELDSYICELCLRQREEWLNICSCSALLPKVAGPK